MQYEVCVVSLGFIDKPLAFCRLVVSASAGYLMDALDPQPARVLLADSVVGEPWLKLSRGRAGPERWRTTSCAVIGSSKLESM